MGSWEPRGKDGQTTFQGWLAVTQVSLTILSDEGKGKSALKIESKLQAVGTEGSIPGRLLSGMSVRAKIQESTPLWGHPLAAHQAP